ncbi:MAG: M1 aminopeptidase family protein [Planctomycetota bacterium]
MILLLQSAPVVYGEALVEKFHTYDLERVFLRVEPHRAGARVRCDLTLTAKRSAPVRFLLTASAIGLTAERDGKRVAASTKGGNFEALVRVLAPGATGIPRILVLPTLRAGEQATFTLRYDWRPRGGMALARSGWIQTHIGSFWAPLMADERYDAVVELITPDEAVAAGRKEKIDGGWRFTSVVPAQAVPVVVGPFEVHRKGALELYLPPGVETDARKILSDTEASLATLERWFGPRATREFRVVVDPRRKPMPSYCGGNFVVLARRSVPESMRPESWLSHIAHECAHAWWGHAVGMPVIGGGGNFLREGIPQWCGIAVAGDPVLWKRHVAAYLATGDLRRDEAGIFANEATLANATYLDPPRVAYWRGALVLRAIETRLGRDEFLRRLASIQKDRKHGFLNLDEFADRFDAHATVDYYARTSRLPDFALESVGAGKATVRCLDARWPDGRVPCVVRTAAGSTTMDVELKNGRGTLSWTGDAERIEIDPQRILLDPVHANNVWPRQPAARQGGEGPR